MISVVLLGTGNVAQHLFDAFLTHKNIKILQVAGRNKKALSHFAKYVKTTTDFKNIAEADIYIIAVSDGSISTVSEELKNKSGVVVHTSGSIAMQALDDNNRKGVFYPLQTFTKGKKIDFKTIPICIEAENKDDLELVKQLGSMISNRVIQITSEQRKQLHLAAVFVNNFTNHMYQIGDTICKQYRLPFDILEPLIQETSKKIKSLSPLEAQTGPARRGDTETIKNHINLLKNDSQKEIYSLLSRSIQETYGEKL